MAIRIVGVDLPQNKCGEVGLTYIYGIGRSSAKKILAEAGVDPSIKVQDWTDDQAAKIREIIARYGVDRVLFGTDYPMWNVETDLKRFYTLGYNKEDSDKILYQNAVKVYGLKL